MAVTTSGARSGVLPGINYGDPRLLAPTPRALGTIREIGNTGNMGNTVDIGAAVGQGMGLTRALLQISEEAKARPLRQQLAEIQLQEAVARSPVTTQLAQLELGEAQRRASIPNQIVESVDITGGERRMRPLDIDAGFGNIEAVEEFTPRVRTTTGREIGVGGTERPFTRTDTLATGQQIQSEADKAASLAESRLAQARIAEMRATTYDELSKAKATTDALRAENDRIKADAAAARVQNALNDPGWTNVRSGEDPTTGELVVNQVSRATGELRAIRTGQRASASSIDRLISALSGPPSAETQSETPSFATEAEAEAAGAAGLLKPGTKIMIGGRPARWQ